MHRSQQGGKVSQWSIEDIAIETWAVRNFTDCQLGDKRLNERALEIGKALVGGFGQGLYMNFKDTNPH